MTLTPEERVRRSKLLSYVLRHGPGDFGLTLEPGGFVEIDLLLAALERHGRPLTHAHLDEIVVTNPKQRFEFDASGTRIRARQGHSTEVDLQYEPLVPPTHLYHGTAAHHVESILAQGLLRGQRHAVHLTDESGIAVTMEVARRHGRPTLFRIRAAEMHATGHVFHRTGNAVWLTEHVPPEFLEIVEEDAPTGETGRSLEPS